jgi:hypothetical protein
MVDGFLQLLTMAAQSTANPKRGIYHRQQRATILNNHKLALIAQR